VGVDDDDMPLDEVQQPAAGENDQQVTLLTNGV
jgi:hypothetical protein